MFYELWDVRTGNLIFSQDNDFERVLEVALEMEGRVGDLFIQVWKDNISDPEEPVATLEFYKQVDAHNDRQSVPETPGDSTV